MNRLDPTLLHIHQPDTHYKGTKRGDIAYYSNIPEKIDHSFDIKYDINGFRNSREMTNPHVMIIGDSFIEAVLTPVEETLTTVLAGMKNNR